MAYEYSHECKLDGYALSQQWIVPDEQAVASKTCRVCGEMIPVNRYFKKPVSESVFLNSATWEMF